MPFFESGATPQPVFPDAAPPHNPLRPSLSETVSAAFLKNNPTVNLFRSQHVDMYPPEEGHNPMDTIRGSKYEERYADRYIGSRSTSETAAITRRIDEENGADSTLDAAGFAGTIASIAAGTLDPTIALPAGTIYRGVKGGISLLRSGASTAAAGGAQIAVQEAALHGLQETRTKLESTTAIGSGVLLAGFIGAGAAALLSRAERGVLTRALDHERAAIDAHARGEPPPEPPRLEPATEPTARIGTPEPVTPEQMAEIRARLDESSARVDAVPPESASVAAVERRAGVWANADHDIPVTILDKPALKGNDGRMYQQVEFEGKPSFVPADELREGSVGEAAAEGGSALPQSGGAAAADSRRLEMVPYGLAWSSRISPTRFVVESSSVPARRTMADTASMPYRFKDNIPVGGGAPIATTQGPPIDIVAKMAIEGTRVQISDELGQLYSRYRFGDPDATAPRLRGNLDRVLGRDEGQMTYTEFKKEVSRAMITGDQHAIPEITQGAQTVRKVFDTWLERAQEAGIIPKGDVSVKTAQSYLQRIYNKEAIRANETGFVDKIANWLRADQSTKRATQGRLFDLIEQRNKVIDTIEKSTSEREIAAARMQHDAIQTKIEREIADWDGTSVASAQKKIKAAEQAAADRAIRDAEKLGAGVEAPKISRTQALRDSVDKAVEKILKSDREKSLEELRGVAHEIKDRVLGTPDGRLPYDMDNGGPGIGWRPDRDPPRGPLAQRELNIPDVAIWDYIEQDIERIVHTHLRTVVPDVLFTERFGDVHQTNALKEILNDYNSRIDAAKSQKAKQALATEREGVMERMVGVRDRVRGVADSSASAQAMGRTANVMKGITNLTTGGMFAVASLADFAGSIFRSGFASTLRDGWVPYFKGLMNLDEGAFKQFTSEIRALGIGTDVASNGRFHSVDDTMDLYRPQSRFERTLNWANEKFFIANFLSGLTDMQKQIAAHPIASNIIRYSKAAAEGKATKEQLTSLAEAGIDMNKAGRIWQEFSENGGEIKNGVYLPNTADWKSRDAAAAFNGALYRDVNIAVVTPGQEKSLFLSTPVGSVLGLYKTFTAAATERILIANLQRRDAQVLQGLVAAVGLGMLSYKINAMLGGQKTSDRPQDWVKEGISRSGVTGWFEEANALASKSTRGGVDVYRMLGADKQLSRYASRSTLDQLLGPTAGKVESLLKVTGALGSKLTNAQDNDWTAADTSAVRKLTAFQNLIWLRSAMNQLEEGINGRLGVEVKH